MRFTPAPLAGVYLIQLEPHTDARGMFARAFCAREFAKRGLQTSFVQANVSTNERAGTLRGLHFQRSPHAEVKLVRCTRGAVYDVVVDMRTDSPTYLRWFGAELTSENGAMMYVPQGVAHGYQALSDGASVFYMVSTYYTPAAEGGLRHDDPALAIGWPRPVSAISDKDARWPLLRR